MKTLTFDQMEQVNGGGWKCWAGMALTTIAFAGYVSAAAAVAIGTGGAAAPFLIAGGAYIVSAAGTAVECGW